MGGGVAVARAGLLPSSKFGPPRNGLILMSEVAFDLKSSRIDKFFEIFLA